MAKMRVTNSHELEVNDIARVFETEGGYRVVFTDGAAMQYRRTRLTPEAAEAFAEFSIQIGR